MRRASGFYTLVSSYRFIMKHPVKRVSDVSHRSLFCNRKFRFFIPHPLSDFQGLGHRAWLAIHGFPDPFHQLIKSLKSRQIRVIFFDFLCASK